MLTHDLRAGGRRLTKPRKAILELLERAKMPLSAGEIYARLDQQKLPVDLVTVYRTLAVLKEIGLVTPVELQEGRFRFEVRHGREHRHHIRCRECGRIVDLMLCPLRRLTKLVEQQTRFLVESHSLEFFGRCAKCQ